MGKQLSNEKAKIDVAKLFEIKQYKNKYQQTAEAIYPLIGGSTNYSNPWNCMTRFRVNIKDKDKVDLVKIKELSLVKGTNWSGEQLQIIIGGEVGKVMDEFKKYETNLVEQKTSDVLELKNSKQKTNLAQKSVLAKIMAAVTGIMTPCLPVLMAMGIFSALQAILLQAGAIVDVGNMNQVASVDLLSGVMYILAKSILNCLGIFFIYNTTKYFNGNTFFAIAVGIILLSRGLFGDLFFSSDGSSVIMDGKFNEQAWLNAQFGDWVNHAGKQGWLLFKMGDLPVVVGGYEGSILTFIAGGFLVTYLDKWIKTWMPSIIDIVFRPTLVVLLSLTGIWLLLGPVLGIIEFGISKAMLWIGNDIPYGFGVAIFAALWQPIVLTGMHVPIVVVGLLPSLPSALMAGLTVATFAQTGAGFGILLRTRNANLRAAALGGVAAGFFGVTEPIIFGINLPRLKPFLFGVAGAFVGGLVSGILGIDQDIMGGLGIFTILSFTGSKDFAPLLEQGLAVLTWVIGIGVAASLTFFFANEKVSELRTIKKGLHKVYFQVFGNGNKELKTKFNQEFNEQVNLVSEQKLAFKAYSKYLSMNSKYEQKLVSIETKESKHREKLYKKIISLHQAWNKKQSLTKIQEERLVKLKQQYETYNLDSQKAEVMQKITANNSKYENQNQELKKTTKQIYDQLVEKINKDYQQKINNPVFLQAVYNTFYNGLNATDISYQIVDKKPVLFKVKKPKLEKEIK